MVVKHIDRCSLNDRKTRRRVVGGRIMMYPAVLQLLERGRKEEREAGEEECGWMESETPNRPRQMTSNVDLPGDIVVYWRHDIILSESRCVAGTIFNR